MHKRTFKSSLYGQIAEITKAMANAHRLEIVDLLANGSKSVAQIAEETAMSVANASQHLQVLKRNKLVETERQGNYVYYRLSGLEIYKAWQAMRNLALELSSDMKETIFDYREKWNSKESLTLDELGKQQHVLLLDVRHQEEFRDRHLPGAMNIPIGELKDRLHELSADLLIVTYCRGPFCTYADEAVSLLKEHGFKAVRLEENAIDYHLLAS